MENGSDFFEVLLKTQRESLDAWMEGARRFQESVWGAAGAAADKTGPFDLYNSWIGSMADSFAGTSGRYNPETITDIYSGLFGPSGTYMKLYDMWLSTVKAAQGKALDLDAYRKLFDVSGYKEVLDLVFGLPLPESLKESADQSAQFVNTWETMASRFLKPWADVTQQNIGMFPEGFAGETGPFMSMVSNMFGAFFNTFGKVFRFPAVGKNREEVELIFRNIDKYSAYLARYVEFQHLIYTTGLKAMDKVAAAVNDKIKEDGGIRSFNDFLSLWVDVNEKTYLELFRTEEFSGMQAQLLDAALDVRKHMNELMELYLEDFPVALRSEVDDLAKTVHDLRRRIYDMEKRAKGAENGQYAEIRSEVEAMRRRMDDLSAGAVAPAQTGKRGRRATA